MQKVFETREAVARETTIKNSVCGTYTRTRTRTRTRNIKTHASVLASECFCLIPSYPARVGSRAGISVLIIDRSDKDLK